MAIKWTNNASTTLASSISAVATTITVASSGGSLFPTLGAGDYFYATLVDSSNNLEIVKVTDRTGDVMTVVRGQEGTTANAYVGGDKFELRPTAAGFAAAAEGENIVDLPIAQGGTGADNAADARANLDVLQDTASDGIVARTGTTSVARTITAGNAGISVDDGNGVSGNPVIYNEGVWSLTAGDGITLSAPDGDVTIDNDGVLSFNGQTGDITFTSEPPQIVFFTSSGTWTKDAGLKAVIVEVIGGGGGGSTRGTVSKTTNFGAGGGAGGYARKVILAASLGATETVTVGAAGTASKTGTTNTDGGSGGTSSFGSHCSATGGGGGQKYDGAAPATTFSVGGTGGTASNGDTNLSGQDGQDGYTTLTGWGGRASGAYGGPGFGSYGAISATAAVLASDGIGYGHGGAGGTATGNNNAGVGAGGAVIVYEFY